ncbi:(2Fe-2S) ferredoxin domain-containing protein [Sphingomonas canadensis]|uniref:(2Fe-2S) ferredoxin domain-containing protein n=1 Tax=Sphingomonas canadensis TaxID=1219257 RepID=A0ABW3H3G9_9SPHN|nr:(2Fe-2S) ferredoxin domain-containing protein [Sphingomonas canadensis]MCW3835605.1 (2Fe-2S) ferredoxin domain-containing protein [Sphingomonas canadensis]
MEGRLKALRLRSNWDDAVLVCAKCSKKLDGGFGPRGRQPLAKALRKHLRLKKGRKARAGIVEVKCLGVCPKGAVTVLNGAASREWLIVPAGMALDAVAAELGLEDQPAA